MADRRLIGLRRCPLQVEELQRYHRAFVPEIDRRFARLFRSRDHVINSFACHLQQGIWAPAGRLYVTYHRVGFRSQFRKVMLTAWHHSQLCCCYCFVTGFFLTMQVVLKTRIQFSQSQNLKSSFFCGGWHSILPGDAGGPVVPRGAD